MTTADPNPHLQLHTLFIIGARGRIIGTREPSPAPGPSFMFIRGRSSCVWACRADVPESIAIELGRLASEETPSADWARPLRHADRYAALLNATRVRSGPVFAFPDAPVDGGHADVAEEEAELNHHFSGWVTGEIAGGRAPVFAIREGGRAVSVCFCGRRSDFAAEAGIETAAAFRGRGYAPRAAIAWARQIRQSGVTPLYSTDWSNQASLAVARKLALVTFAADFSFE